MAAKKNESHEIQITRVYDAPLAAVWDAWTDTDQVAQWWGPRGFTLTTHGKDLRPGGTWIYTMHGPDGVDYPNHTVYHEVVPQAKLVYDHGGSADRPPLFRVTVLFAEVDGGTRMDMTMALATPEAAAEIRKFIKKAGGEATWDRLAEYLRHEASGVDAFVINRSFAAPIETLWDMWTQPEHFCRWLPPAGLEMEFIRCDIRHGGGGFFKMSNAGFAFYGRVVYLEMERPTRIVYTQQFCDEHENVASHPGAPVWPTAMLTTVLLAAEGPEQTRVTVTSEPYGSFSAAEAAAFRDERSGMTLGWTGSFDALEALLENAASPSDAT